MSPIFIIFCRKGRINFYPKENLQQNQNWKKYFIWSVIFHKKYLVQFRVIHNKKTFKPKIIGFMIQKS